MRSFAAFSNHREPRRTAEQLAAAADECGFEPDLALFYATQKYGGKYDDILRLLHDRLGDVPCIGGSVDGMLYPHDLRTDGAMLVLCGDADGKIRVESASGASTSANVEQVASRVSCKKGAVLMHFPIIHVPTMATSLAMVARGKYYSYRCRNARSPQDARQQALGFSEYLDRINFIYPVRDIIMPVARACGGRVPVVGAGLVHARMQMNTPTVFANFRDVGSGVAAMVVEQSSAITCYEDLFPNRGTSVDESIKNVKNDINFVREYKATFSRNILISLGDRLAGDEFASILRQPHRAGDADGVQIADLGDGTYSVHKPYGIAFTNPKTNGLFFMGAGDYYPFGVFPIFADLKEFSSSVYLCRESMLGRHMDFISTLRQVPGSGFNLFFIDAGAIPAFGMHIYEYLKEVQLHLKDNYAGVMAAPPAAYLPPEYQRRPYITEISPRLTFSSTGCNVCMEF